MVFLHRACEGARTQVLQQFSGPLPARPLPGAVLGLGYCFWGGGRAGLWDVSARLPAIDSALPGPHRDNLKLLHATPLYCLLPRDASEGLAEGKRAPPLPGRTPSWKLLSSLLEGPASGLHHLPWSTRESPESSKCLNFGLLGLL